MQRWRYWVSGGEAENLGKVHSQEGDGLNMGGADFVGEIFGVGFV